jgi:hypothetical protein
MNNRFTVLLVFIAFTAVASSSGVAGQQQEASWRPLIVYYSLTGSTRIVAAELGRVPGCERMELTSLRKRTGFWKVNCVFDQLFDREDELGAVALDAAQYSPIIIACPIWIHRLASPMRTFLDHRRLAGKHVYVVVTHQGNYGEKDKQAVRRFLELQGMHCAGYGAVLTRGRTESEIVDQTKRFIEINFPEMKTSVVNITQ